nr:MAG TPA: hypothetical protein [Bacteriophage sp.]
MKRADNHLRKHAAVRLVYLLSALFLEVRM